MDQLATGKRVLVVAPSFVLASGGLAISLASLAQWGDTQGEHPAWLPPFVGLHVGLPMFLIGGRCFASNWLDTRSVYRVVLPQCLAGLLVFATGLSVWLLAGNLMANGVYGDSTTFWLDPDTPVRAVLAGAFVSALLVTAPVSLISYAYARAVEARPPLKWDKQEGEPDAIGALISERRHHTAG